MGRKYEGPEPFILVRALSHAAGRATIEGRWSKGQVEIHPGALVDKERIIAHEALHLVCPDWDEDRVERSTEKVQKALAKIRE
jgi:hypothetical protein